MTQFAEGNRVYDVGLARHGKVIRAGVQQSEIRFDDGQTRIIPNQYLQPVPISKIEPNTTAKAIAANVSFRNDTSVNPA
jgi:hypothetical protein